MPITDFQTYQRESRKTWSVIHVDPFGLSLDEVASANIEKLFSRLERGQIRGDGDER